MTFDVEQIVREVIAEIERQQGSASAPASCTTAMPDASPSLPKQDARELVVCSRVVSLAEIGDRLSHIRRLVVPADAIITPSVRDALADRNIAIDFGTSNTNTPATAARLLLVAARTKYDPAGLVAALGAEGLNVETQTSGCLIQTADELASCVNGGMTLGVLMTHDVAAALCLANRLSGLRAVAAGNRADAIDAARAVGANVLIVDPQGKGSFQLKQMIAEFGRLGPWPCPEPLQSRLM